MPWQFSNSWGVTVSAASNSCFDVSNAFQVQSGPDFGWGGCSTEPVAVGTVMAVSYAEGETYTTITAVIQPPVAPSSSSASGVVVNVSNTLLPDLDASGGAQIAGAVLAVWAIGWAFRMLIRALNSDGNSVTSTSESE